MVVRKVGAAILVATAGFALASPAGAQVFQTDAAMTPLPQPVGAAELTLVTGSWGHNTMTQSWKDPMGANLVTPIIYGQYYMPPTFPQFVDGDAITLEGLFKWRKEKINVVTDAKTAPGYFSPACGFSGQFLLMGGNCNVSFGWYNVEDPKSTTKPSAAEIYEFIPSDNSYLHCLDENGGPKTDGFCPLAWDNLSPRNLSIKQWTPKPFDSGNIKTDPRYKGKYIGFALIGNPAKGCSENKYSMLAYNQKNSNGVPWITTLMYQSTVDPEGFYMAFEDLPMSPADWHKTGVAGSTATNDGDFNDFVFYVSGITCAGGNQPCDTGLKGACSVGRTDCAAEGEVPVCRPVVKPGPEICDNVDNDCNGVVDDATPTSNPCPDPDASVCFQGTCVGNCSKGEFPCPGNLTCDTSGHCVDPSCLGVDCPMGQACHDGKCVDPCTGVVCPYGAQCQLGQCVDPCAGVTCPSDRVCEKGLCVANCTCRGCDTGLSCAADGRCIDTACAGVNCAAGLTCQAGKCIDPCAGVVCPNGGTCSNGVCSMGSGAVTSAAVGAGGSLFGDDAASAGAGGTSGSISGGGGTGSGGKGKPQDAGCSCRIGSTDDDAPYAWLGAVVGLGLLLRNRRREKRAAR